MVMPKICLYTIPYVCKNGVGTLLNYTWFSEVFAFSHERCFECKHRRASQVLGWVTTRVFSYKSLPHIHTHVFQSNLTSPHHIKQLIAIVAELNIKIFPIFLGTYF